MLDPLPLDTFLDEILGKTFVRLEGARHPTQRRGLLGEDAAATLLTDFDRLSSEMTYHVAEPKGPPPPIARAADPADFKARIESFHAAGYTVRLPKVRKLGSDLDLFMRALEAVFHKPAEAAVFWSRGDAKAPVHHDDCDLIAIQLAGRKRWYLSTEPSELPNDWKTIPRKPETLGNHKQIDMQTGDLLYLPRGTIHTVDGLADSIHVSIGFVPLTLREAMIACIDQLSDFNRPLRDMVAPRLGVLAQSGDFGRIPDQVRQGMAWLTDACRNDSFVAGALQRRSARAVSDMEKPKPPRANSALGASSRVRHAELAICHLSGDENRIDFAYPGGHQYVHRGAEQSVLFIARTPEFRIKDVPGDIDDDVRIALVGKLVEAGFLDVVEN